MLKLLTLMVLFFLSLSNVDARSKHPDNEVVEFKRSGAWEVWCIKLGDTGEIVCDLNLVIIYKPHPDFRAMIPRVYWTKDRAYAIEIEYERQTSFSNAYLGSESGARFALNQCDRPCWMNGSDANEFVGFVAENAGLKINFTDYFFEDFQIDFDAEGFKQGLDFLKEMQVRLRE